MIIVNKAEVYESERNHNGPDTSSISYGDYEQVRLAGSYSIPFVAPYSQYHHLSCYLQQLAQQQQQAAGASIRQSQSHPDASTSIIRQQTATEHFTEHKSSSGTSAIKSEAAARTVKLPAGPQTHTQTAPGSSQNAFALLMRASKGAGKAPAAGGIKEVSPSSKGSVGSRAMVPLSGGRSKKVAPGSGGAFMAVVPGGGGGSKAVAPGDGGGGFKAGWSEALQRVAANPER